MIRHFSQRVASPVVRFGKSIEPLEQRCMMASDVQSIDGTGNNLANPAWGSTSVALLRLSAAGYGDGLSTPAGVTRPSARAISNAVAAHPADDVLSETHLSAFAYLWGQFIDHDMDLTTSASPREALNVSIPIGDASFDPNSTGTQIIPLSRSKYVTDATSVRQQVNDITAFLDGSMIYGSDATRAAALREMSGGRLRTSAGNMLPYNTTGLANANDTHQFADSELFLAGDVRANENSELTALQTLFVREHNRLSGVIAASHPTWNDERLYQAARRLVIAEVQNITYNEYLPALLGRNALPAYRGYKPGVNAGISTEFSTAAFRLGHSMLANDVEFITNDGEEFMPEMELADVFFNPDVIETSGVDPILKYVASSNSEEIDSYVVDSLRNFLFGQPGQGGLDLAALNIQRGRDHGLASYNDTRVALGLSRLTSFDQISSDAQTVGNLKSVYASVDDVDLWVGGLAEDHVAGSNLGPTFQKILVDQFTRLRDGDRFWFERALSNTDLQMVRGMTLANIVKANTDLTNLQSNVFVFDVSVSGQVFRDANGNGRRDNGEIGASGVTIQLIDEAGAVADAAVTRGDGTYRFTGVQLGDYTVQPLVLSGVKLVGAQSVPIDVTRGQNFTNVNFATAIVNLPKPPAPLPRNPAPQPQPRPQPPGVTTVRSASTVDVLQMDRDKVLI
jgi:hypothetical protein